MDDENQYQQISGIEAYAFVVITPLSSLSAIVVLYPFLRNKESRVHPCDLLFTVSLCLLIFNIPLMWTGIYYFKQINEPNWLCELQSIMNDFGELGQCYMCSFGLALAIQLRHILKNASFPHFGFHLLALALFLPYFIYAISADKHGIGASGLCSTRPSLSLELVRQGFFLIFICVGIFLFYQLSHSTSKKNKSQFHFQTRKEFATQHTLFFKCGFLFIGIARLLSLMLMVPRLRRVSYIGSMYNINYLLWPLSFSLIRYRDPFYSSRIKLWLNNCKNKNNNTDAGSKDLDGRSSSANSICIDTPSSLGAVDFTISFSQDSPTGIELQQHFFSTQEQNVVIAPQLQLQRIFVSSKSYTQNLSALSRQTKTQAQIESIDIGSTKHQKQKQNQNQNQNEPPRKTQSATLKNLRKSRLTMTVPGQALHVIRREIKRQVILQMMEGILTCYYKFVSPMPAARNEPETEVITFPESQNTIECFSFRRFFSLMEDSVDLPYSLNIKQNEKQIEQVSSMGDGGKSGSFFFVSHDGALLIKTVTLEELSQLKLISDPYCKYLRNNPHSLLVRILGHYTYHLHSHNNLKFHFLLMTNIASQIAKNGFSINNVYDLKGSTYGRQVNKIKHSKPKQSQTQSPNKTLKDLDFIANEKKLYLQKKIQPALQECLLKDVAFLQDCKLIDYSLLLIIACKEGQQQFQQANDNDFAHQYRAGFQSTKQQHVKYFLGIIDYLQNYSIQKQMEKYSKQLINLSINLNTSAQPPLNYAQRFVQQMSKIIIGD